MGRDQSQIRIKSEIGTVKHVKALQCFFSLAQISSIVFLNVKKPAFTPYSGVCVCVGGGGGGGGWVKSTMTPLSPTVSRVSTGVGGCGSGYKCTRVNWYMRALNNNGNEHRR